MCSEAWLFSSVLGQALPSWEGKLVVALHDDVGSISTSTRSRASSMLWRKMWRRRLAFWCAWAGIKAPVSRRHSHRAPGSHVASTRRAPQWHPRTNQVSG
ncbi:hypothetical protein GBAR_LOCUS24377 [Geodia barretti]|uniref:Uncharacterized protein n=1 Tax=Geodia barretti TaxID=519541 RepID=A0AA35XAQ0_GEOBA|nr:hypothetical protein GBAR_LOCUS24377 [Geodia barretti]